MATTKVAKCDRSSLTWTVTILLKFVAVHSLNELEASTHKTQGCQIVVKNVVKLTTFDNRIVVKVTTF